MGVDPLYTKRESLQWRGPTDSRAYNERVENTYKDLVVLFNRARLSGVEREELYRRMAKELASVSIKIEDLQSRLDALSVTDKIFAFNSIDHIDNDRFDDEVSFEIPEVDRLTVDTANGLLLLPKIETSSLSKLIFVDPDDHEVVPSTLETRVVGTLSSADNETATIDTSNPEFAFYRRPGMIWERNVIVDAPDADGAELTLYVKVPTDLFTTENSNVVTLQPFPSFGMTIKEIAFTTTPDPMMRDSDGYTSFNSDEYYAGEEAAVGWVVPGGWTGLHEGDDAATSVGSRAFYFRPQPVTGLRLVLHQPSYVEEAGKYIYSYGLSFMDLRYDKFLSEGRTILRFDAPEGETISSIDNVSANIWNVSPTYVNPDDTEQSFFLWDTIWETALDSGTYTRTPVANSAKVWIEITLRERLSTPPAVTSFVVEYS